MRVLILIKTVIFRIALRIALKIQLKSIHSNKSTCAEDTYKCNHDEKTIQVAMETGMDTKYALIKEWQYFNKHSYNHLFFTTSGHLQCPGSITFMWHLHEENYKSPMNRFWDKDRRDIFEPILGCLAPISI